MMNKPVELDELCGTGVVGLDEVLVGGLPRARTYLVTGEPGTGKTTMALQFLLEGKRQGETSVYATFTEEEEEVRQVAASHGWDLDGVHILDLVPTEKALIPEDDYSVFPPSEVDLGQLTRAVMDAVDALAPLRVVIDSLAVIRTLAQSPFRYKRQIVALKQFFMRRNCTALLLDDLSDVGLDPHVGGVVHGVLSLKQTASGFGDDRRNLRVIKLRGRAIRGGYHDLVIRRGGVRVFPRLTLEDVWEQGPMELLSSGIANLDKMLGGGFASGTGVLFQGPSGTGKSSLALQFVAAAAKRGARSSIFLFEETWRTAITRAEGLGMGLQALHASGLVTAHAIDPGELTPGAFAQDVLDQVDAGARIVVIDTLNGYMNAMPEENFLTLQLRKLLTQLARSNVLTIMIIGQHGILGDRLHSPIEASYVADAVLLFRQFELEGELGRAISVLKKREGHHERYIAELRLRPGRIEVSEPLKDLRWVFSGMATRVTSDRPEHP